MDEYSKRSSDNRKDPDQNREQHRTFSLSDAVPLWAGDDQTPATQDRHSDHYRRTVLFRGTLENII